MICTTICTPNSIYLILILLIICVLEKNYSQAAQVPCTSGKNCSPKFIPPYLNVTAQEGKDVQFLCHIDDIGNHKVSWIKTNPTKLIAFNERLYARPKNRFQIKRDEKTKTWTLDIKDVSISDIGGYICQVNTKPTTAQIAFLNLDEYLTDSESGEGSGESGAKPEELRKLKPDKSTDSSSASSSEEDGEEVEKIEVRDKEFVMTEDGGSGEEEIIKARSYVKYCTCRRSIDRKKYCSCRKTYIDV